MSNDHEIRLEHGQPNRRRPWMLCLLCAVALTPMLFMAPGIVVGDTVTSRLATVYALVHHGTWYIDRPSEAAPNPFEVQTVDKVRTASGRMLSSKPPVLPLLMTVEYAVMRKTTGLSLDEAADLRPILSVMIATLIKFPYILGLAFLVLTARLFLEDDRRAALLLLAALATPLPGYACQLNNHTPAAAALFAALYFGLSMYADKRAPTPWRFMAFGFSSAAVFVLDMPITIYPAAMGLLLFARFPRQSVLWSLAGAAPLLLLHFGLMAVIAGNPLPVQLQESMYNFRNSYWRNPIGVDGLNESRWLYLFHMKIGRFGTFLLFPILILALPGAVLGLRDKHCPARMAALAALGAFAVQTLYYVFETNNYGGAAYGFRWHVGAMPVLLLLTMPALSAIRSPRLWLLCILLFIPSLYSAWECLQAPWGASHEWTCRLLFGPVY